MAQPCRSSPRYCCARSAAGATGLSPGPGLLTEGAPGEEVARPIEGVEPHPHPREGVRPTFFTVDNAQCMADDEAGIPQHRHRFSQSATGRDDVLQKAHEVPLVERAFDPIRCAVFLGLTAHDDER